MIEAIQETINSLASIFVAGILMAILFIFGPRKS